MVAIFNKYALRELKHPRAIQFDPDGQPLNKFKDTREMPLEDFELGPKVRVAGTTWAAQVLGFQGKHRGAAD
jgi:hypothetical protein